MSTLIFDEGTCQLSKSVQYFLCVFATPVHVNSGQQTDRYAKVFNIIITGDNIDFYHDETDFTVNIRTI